MPRGLAAHRCPGWVEEGGAGSFPTAVFALEEGRGRRTGLLVLMKPSHCEASTLKGSLMKAVSSWTCAFSELLSGGLRSG
jgi:hypothetical protein